MQSSHSFQFLRGIISFWENYNQKHGDCVSEDVYTPERLDEIKFSARGLLFVGQLRDLEDVSECLNKQYLKLDELHPVLQEIWQESASKQTPFREQAIKRFTNALGGNLEVAKKLVGIYEINMFAEQLFHSFDVIRKQQSSLDVSHGGNPFLPFVRVETDKAERALKAALVAASGCSRVLANTVVDIYIANVKTNLGIDAGIEFHR